MNKAGLTLLCAGLAFLPAVAMSNDFSTVTRVHYVMDCMDANPQMNLYESSYKCSCVVDKLADAFTEQEFDDINAGYMYRNLPADRGATFRDDKQIRSGLKKFETVHADAYKSCHLR